MDSNISHEKKPLVINEEEQLNCRLKESITAKDNQISCIEHNRLTELGKRIGQNEKV